MVETDWRKILSLSQTELKLRDKEELCESLSWMEVDDIELSFFDLKTLFKVAQDILKFKSEQVNSLQGESQLEKARKNLKYSEDSPSKSSDSALETLTHQEELIKSNKETIEQLRDDIAELEIQKGKLTDNDKDSSESSKDPLSEIDTIEKLENEVVLKNKHIRKLLIEIKNIETENAEFKEKISKLKDRLSDATKVIENLTEQIVALNTENTKMKDLFGTNEATRQKYVIEIETMKQKLAECKSEQKIVSESLTKKLQHWKNIARTKIAQNDVLSTEINSLKTDYNKAQSYSANSEDPADKQSINKLQDKLMEATNEMMSSVNYIEYLKKENQKLKMQLFNNSQIQCQNESVNEKDNNMVVVDKLKQKNKELSNVLKESEAMIETREKQLNEVYAQLKIYQSGNKGIHSLLKNVDIEKSLSKSKDISIKSLVSEINALQQALDNIEVENEAMRIQLKLEPNTKISPHGILSRYQKVEKCFDDLKKNVLLKENFLTTLEVENHLKDTTIEKLKKFLLEQGHSEDLIRKLCEIDDLNGCEIETNESPVQIPIKEFEEIVKENEGLRKGLQELLEYLKNNSTTTSGILTLECPSLESVMNAMEARHSAGWFAPHMTAIMELKSALGGKDALLTALNETRKETFDVKMKLKIECDKTQLLQQRLEELESTTKEVEKQYNENSESVHEKDFGMWMVEKRLPEYGILDESQVKELISRGNNMFENHIIKSMNHFHLKYIELYNNMTSVAIQAENDKKEWQVKEDNYKDEILKLQMKNNDEDSSTESSGIVNFLNTDELFRRCNYLQNMIVNIKSINDNLRNTCLDLRKDNLLIRSDSEIKMQKFIIKINELIEMLRNSVSMELFFKQNKILNSNILEIRRNINNIMNNKSIESTSHDMKEERSEILNSILAEYENKSKIPKSNRQNYMSEIERTILEKQVETLYSELEQNKIKINDLEKINTQIQSDLSNIIDKNLASVDISEHNVINEQKNKLIEENTFLKEECERTMSKLQAAVLQIKQYEQQKLAENIELNLLRHQILDLQSENDTKSIIARLSGEILVAHLGASENAHTIERLNSELLNEKQKRMETDEMLFMRENIFSIYTSRYRLKFSFMFEMLQALRQEYQGALPLAVLENQLQSIDENHKKSRIVDDKLNEVEDLWSSLMTKQAVIDQILNINNSKCSEDNECPHILKLQYLQSVKSREEEMLNTKIHSLEQSRQNLLEKYNKLEKTYLLVSEAFKYNVSKPSLRHDTLESLEVEDISEDSDSDSAKTYTIANAAYTPENSKTFAEKDEETTSRSHSIKDSQSQNLISTKNTTTQTTPFTKSKSIQVVIDLPNKNTSNTLQEKYNSLSKDLSDAMSLAQQRHDISINLGSKNSNLEKDVENLRKHVLEKENTITELHKHVTSLQNLLEQKTKHTTEKQKEELAKAAAKNANVIQALKKLEEEKHVSIENYKQLLDKERNDFIKTLQKSNTQILELQKQIDSNFNGFKHSTGSVTEFNKKNSSKIAQLENELFILRSELDCCKNELMTCQTETERWKCLANERLIKIEHVNKQLEERHSQEVDSYKAEIEHWISQLNESKRDQTEQRAKTIELKTIFTKQMTDKDTHIDHLRNVIHGLKNQILNMQTVISANDPSFDLSAIVEVEGSESPRESDHLDFRDSSLELGDEIVPRVPTTSSAIWQEPLIDRLRREKNLVSKQNNMLRRQIKALAARERRSRLEAINLKNQNFRISTSGNKATSSDSVALLAKISSLQAQLASARRESQSNVSLWDKWKKATQASERWQNKYDEKCNELSKLESTCLTHKSAVARLEKEKRTLLTKISESTSTKHKQKSIKEHAKTESDSSESEMVPSKIPSHITTQALLERIEAQQRRIAAMEIAGKGNEPLITEYEKSLAEITMLKGQILKLESALLETQIRSPHKPKNDPAPELEYWKSYCNMLKEENVQLATRLSFLESTSGSPHQRVYDLEQTVLTLRGLVSKLQSEKKSVPGNRIQSTYLPPEISEKDLLQARKQLESCRIEIANLKRSIIDKDNLLERSKDMLKMAAEREDELLSENASLHRRINDSMQKQGFRSA